MTEEEKRRLLRLIFTEIRANTSDDKRVELKLLARPDWVPYLDALKVAAPGLTESAAPDLSVATPERKTRFELATPSLARRCATTAPLPRTTEL